MLTKPINSAVAAGVAAIWLLGSAASSAEVVLRAQTALPSAHPQAASFLKHFVDRVNELGEGVVKIRYVGGPEVTPADRVGAALRRGVFDILWTPASYLAGQVPPVRTMYLQNVGIPKIRENGGFELYSSQFEEKLNAHFLAWGEATGGYYLYTNKPPELDAGAVSLKGLKMRTTPTYRPLQDALGATTVSMPIGDVYTAMERGVIDGFGWPTIGLASQGLERVAKFRIEPPFYNTADVVLINLDRWTELPTPAREVLRKVALDYEEDSITEMQEQAAVDIAAADDAGIEAVSLSEEESSRYLSTAFGAMWDVLYEELGEDTVDHFREAIYTER